ncbi:6567_t:CDS:1, partial [Racocetra persica]
LKNAYKQHQFSKETIDSSMNESSNNILTNSQPLNIEIDSSANKN